MNYSKDNFKHLKCGQRVCVIKSFVDFDNVLHEVGERWVYLGHGFVPYHDGLSLFTDNQNGSHIRLSWTKDSQSNIIDNLESYLESPVSGVLVS